MKISEPQVVIPKWAQVGQEVLDNIDTYSQEKKAYAWNPIGGFIFEGDFSVLEIDFQTGKLFEPHSEEWFEKQKKRDWIAGSTCRWCPDPETDGYKMYFPKRCKDCGTLNSYRQRGRNTARKLLSIKYALALESNLWTFTFPIIETSEPLTEDEIKEIAKTRRRYISQYLFADKTIWHEQFCGINVMECVVTEPGEIRKGRWMHGEDYGRKSKGWSYHIHGHYLILNKSTSKVDLKKAYKKFGKKNDDDNIKMRLHYKNEREYEKEKKNSSGEIIGKRDDMKIMRDYLVGYARKDCLGKYAWVGDRTWRKIRTRLGNSYTDGTLEERTGFNGSGFDWVDEKRITIIAGNEHNEWVQLGLLENIFK